MTKAAIYLTEDFEELTTDEKSEITRLLAYNGWSGAYLSRADLTEEELEEQRAADAKMLAKIEEDRKA